jgi:glycosyltransferase involved in cell wall biosynthesis
MRHPGRVLLVTSSYPRWVGDSTTPFIHHLAQDLRERGWDILVLAPHAAGAARREILDGVPVERFRYLWPESLENVCYDGGALVKLRQNRWNLLKIPFLVIAQWAAILWRVGRYKIILVHSHWILPQGFTVALSAGLLGAPHIATIHGSDVFALRGWIARQCQRFVLRRADAVTVNSSATQAAVEGLAPGLSGLTRIAMGATVPSHDVTARAPMLRGAYRRNAGPLLIFVGRLVEEKGVADLLAAIAIVRTSLPDVTALIVGDGPDRSKFEQQVERLGLGSMVTFTGWLPPDQVQCHLAAADIFVGPSRPGPDGTIEAQGITFIEAMLAGRPVIATAIGGIGDVVHHCRTGLIVAVGATGEIARAIIRLATDDSLAERLGSEGRLLAMQSHTREVSASRFAALYERLTG